MITKITGEQPFQVLTNNFSISPSQEGYTLQISADGVNFSNLFTVGAGVTRLVTGVAANSFYKLSGNQSAVSINWMKTCVTEGGSGGAGNELTPVTEFPVGAEAGTVVALASGDTYGIYQYDGTDWNPAGGEVDLSAYWTSAETQSAITAVEDHLFDDALELPLCRSADLNVLRTDLHIHRHFLTEARVDAGNVSAQDMHQLVLDHDAVNDVAVTDEISHKGIFRLIVHILRGAYLLNPALIHDHHRIGHGEGFLLVMGDKDKGDAQLPLDLHQFPLHILPELQIQGGQRLVQKQHLGFIDDGPGDGNALLLAP